MPATVDRPTRISRTPRRARAVRIFFVAVLVGQAFLLIRAYTDPHVLFGFQPFNESSTWRAEIVRVTTDGRRVPIEEPWPGGYDWDELMGWGSLEDPERSKHAFSSLGTMTDFLDEALDWVADNTPRDTETLRLEAEVSSTRNTRPQDPLVLRSEEREEAT